MVEELIKVSLVCLFQKVDSSELTKRLFSEGNKIPVSNCSILVVDGHLNV